MRFDFVRQFWAAAGPVVRDLWSAIGPLVYVIVGAVIGRASQRKQWKLDNRKQEYKETLAALTRAANRMIDISSNYAIKGEEEKQLYELRVEGIVAIQQNVFIRKQLQTAGALNKWKAMTSSVSRPSKLYDDLRANFEGLLSDILDAADRDL